jgi:hypothetical protein
VCCSVSGRSEVIREVEILIEAGKCGSEIVQIKINYIFLRLPICDTKPTKRTNLFLTYLHYNVTLNMATRSGPQVTIIRESNPCSTASNRISQFDTKLTHLINLVLYGIALV